jgi:hypothetical protein
MAGGGTVSIISQALTQGVTIGAGSYATDVTITSTGSVIYAASAAAFGGAAVTIPAYAGLASLQNAGTVIGQAGTDAGGYGINIAAAGVVTNGGYVAGGTGAGGGGGIKFTGYLGASLDNTGRIYGGAGSEAGGAGVYAGTGAVVYNDGTISGGSVTASGTAAGDAGEGVFLSFGTLLNAGLVSGGGGAGSGYGVVMYGGLLENAGTIAGGLSNGTQAAAVTILPEVAAPGTLVVAPGAVFEGDVIADSTAQNVLGFAPGVELVDGIGNSFQGFSVFEFEPGSAATVSGTETAFDTGQTIVGFGLDDQLVIDNVQISVTTGTGEITLSDGAVVDFAGLSTDDFAVSGDGTNTTLSLNQVNGLLVPAGAGETLSQGVAVDGVTLAGGSLEIIAGSTVTGGITFVGSGSSLIIDEAANGITSIPQDTIFGFTAGDTIQLAGIPYIAAQDSYTVISDGTLSIDANGDVYDLLIAGATIGQDDFVLSNDLAITEVTCYAEGTRISTSRGAVEVEDLYIGDLVQTLHAGMRRIKWIGTRSYDGRFIANNKRALPICIKAGAIADDVPARDLWVSPGHAICIDGALVHAARLVNNVSIIQAERVERVTYFHIELDEHEIIFAENCPAETFMGEYFRKQFHNARAYEELYPGETAPETACLPRLDHGFYLNAIQQRINRRAGIHEMVVSGKLHGYIDLAGPLVCSGWVQWQQQPEVPVCLDILLDDVVVGRVLANLYREDVRDAGYGSGNHGFEYELSPGFCGSIKVRCSMNRVYLDINSGGKVYH